MTTSMQQLEFSKDVFGSWSYVCESCTNKLKLPEQRLDRESETGTGTLCLAKGCYNLANHCIEVELESV